MTQPTRRSVVTAADFGRNFGHLRQTMDDGPLFVTHHGRETHVLLTKSSFDRLNEGIAPVIAGLNSADLGVLLESLPQALMAIDRDGVVLFANRAAHALLYPQTALVGELLDKAAPAIRGSLLENFLRRALDYGEHCTADMPSPIRPDSWIRVDIRPSAEHAILYLADITGAMQRDRLSDRAATAIEGMRLHEGIGQIVINQRGHVTAADPAVCALMGLAEARLVGVMMADTVTRAARTTFREQLDAVCSGKGAAAFDLELLTNSGASVRVACTLVELRGTYGSEGAILTLVPNGATSSC